MSVRGRRTWLVFLLVVGCSKTQHSNADTVSDSGAGGTVSMTGGNGGSRDGAIEVGVFTGGGGPGGAGGRTDAAAAEDAAGRAGGASAGDGAADRASGDAGEDVILPESGCTNVPGLCYSTDFPLGENPISEGGRWTHVGLDWAVVQTVGGKAFGTQSGTGGYDDSYAHLSGFPPDLSISATIYKAPGIPAGDIHEVELHLRWADAPHLARGYECLLHHNGNYAQIVRWEGGFGKFTYLANATAPAPKTGDVLTATAVGDVITFSLNGVELVRAKDSTWATGDPGMGFYREAAGSNTLYGFSSFSVQAL
jgi:hypothetical protein